MDLAGAALRSGDIALAQKQWAIARKARGAPIEAWFKAAFYNVQAGELDQASALLKEAAQFKDQRPMALHQLVLLEERRGNFVEAERYWKDFIAIDARKWWAYSGLAKALREQGRPVDAMSALAKGLQRLPEVPDMVAEPARIAQAAEDWPNAIAEWYRVIERFPELWIGYRGLIQTLVAAGRSNEAEILRLENAPRFSDELEEIESLALTSEQTRNWTQAEISWRSRLALGRQTSRVYYGLAVALRELGNLTEMERVIKAGLLHFPADYSLSIEAARSAERRSDWHEAADCWRTVSSVMPGSLPAILGEISALRQAGSFEAADAAAAAAISAHGDQASVHEAYALNALAAGSPTEALSRLETARLCFPNHGSFEQRALELRSQILDVSAKPSGSPEDTGAG